MARPPRAGAPVALKFAICMHLPGALCTRVKIAPGARSAFVSLFFFCPTPKRRREENVRGNGKGAVYKGL